MMHQIQTLGRWHAPLFICRITVGSVLGMVLSSCQHTNLGPQKDALLHANDLFIDVSSMSEQVPTGLSFLAVTSSIQNHLAGADILKQIVEFEPCCLTRIQGPGRRGTCNAGILLLPAAPPMSYPKHRRLCFMRLTWFSRLSYLICGIECSH